MVSDTADKTNIGGGDSIIDGCNSTCYSFLFEFFSNSFALCFSSYSIESWFLAPTLTPPPPFSIGEDGRNKYTSTSKSSPIVSFLTKDSAEKWGFQQRFFLI